MKDVFWFLWVFDPSMTSSMSELAEIDQSEFFSFIQLLDDTDCWIWTGPSDPNSKAPRFCYAPRKYTSAIRLAHELVIGPLPQGRNFCLCGHRRDCVNPDHTTKDSTSTKKRKPHCPQGHLLTGKRLLVAADGRRICLVCRAERSQRWVEAGELLLEEMWGEADDEDIVVKKSRSKRPGSGWVARLSDEERQAWSERMHERKRNAVPPDH